MKRAFQICIVITILEFILAIIAYNYLPELIPTHWGISGEIDSYGNKIMIFLAPVISMIITFGLYYFPKMDPKGENIKRSGKAYPSVMIMVNFIMVIVLGVTALTSFGFDIPVDKIIAISVGIMLLLIGNYMPKIKQNYSFGIRLPWTLADETIWTKTHRMGGWTFFIMGLLFIIGTLFPAPYNFAIPIVGLFVGIAVVTIYSYKEFKKIS